MISVLLHAGSGLDDYTLHLANGLADFTRVGYSISHDMLERYGNALDPRVVAIPFQRPRRRNLWGITEMRRLAAEIKTFQPDIIHIQNDGWWESYLLHLLSAFPIVNTVHDPIKHIDHRNLLELSLQKFAIQKSAGWVVHSEQLKEVFAQKFHKDPARILIHTHGIFDYYTRFTTEERPREKTLLFFGRLRHNKGADILLRAFASLDLPDWRLIIAGGGPGLDEETALINTLGARLDFRHRRIPDTEVAELFSQAGIVVLPYRHGSQSGVLTLAAAFGCPVVATEVGSLPELAENRKQLLFSKPEDENDLAQKIKELTENKSLRQMLGKNLQEHAQRYWSWQSIAEKTVTFYDQILAAENLK